MGNDVVGSLANLTDPSSAGVGGATVLVDGLETTDKVRASTIKEVRINQNPYSAEFARPGRGRIEVNYTGFVGNLSSSFFGLPMASQPARRMQFSLGFEF